MLITSWDVSEKSSTKVLSLIFLEVQRVPEALSSMPEGLSAVVLDPWPVSIALDICWGKGPALQGVEEACNCVGNHRLIVLRCRHVGTVDKCLAHSWDSQGSLHPRSMTVFSHSFCLRRGWDSFQFFVPKLGLFVLSALLPFPLSAASPPSLECFVSSTGAARGYW